MGDGLLTPPLITRIARGDPRLHRFEWADALPPPSATYPSGLGPMSKRRLSNPGDSCLPPATRPDVDNLFRYEHLRAAKAAMSDAGG